MYTQGQVITGILVDFEGVIGSGIAHLVVLDDDEVAHSIPCENGPTARALEAMFRGGINFGHDRVVCTIGEFGILGSIAPEDEEY